MNVNDIITAVSTLGFPIVMCAALFWYMVQQNDLHRKESDSMRETINELKIAIVELTSHLKGGE